jgi:hypothetical protein
VVEAVRPVLEKAVLVKPLAIKLATISWATALVVAAKPRAQTTASPRKALRTVFPENIESLFDIAFSYWCGCGPVMMATPSSF